MRLHLLDRRPDLLGLLVALVLLGAGATLLHGTGAAFERRDAFAARVAGGTPALSPRRIAAEWRSEIAAQRHTARRDRALGVLLIGTGVLSGVTLAIRHRRDTLRAPIPPHGGAEAAA